MHHPTDLCYTSRGTLATSHEDLNTEKKKNSASTVDFYIHLPSKQLNNFTLYHHRQDHQANQMEHGICLLKIHWSLWTRWPIYFVWQWLAVRGGTVWCFVCWWNLVACRESLSNLYHLQCCQQEMGRHSGGLVAGHHRITLRHLWYFWGQELKIYMLVKKKKKNRC